MFGVTCIRLIPPPGRYPFVATGVGPKRDPSRIECRAIPTIRAAELRTPTVDTAPKRLHPGQRMLKIVCRDIETYRRMGRRQRRGPLQAPEAASVERLNDPISASSSDG